ncbi:MAG: hypothetical protein ABW048_02440 [Sphingobium sp.]
MSKRALSILSALSLFAAPAMARAADDAEAWTTSETALRAPAAGIALPMTVAGLSLSKSGEASNGGKAIDNVAQYLSEDGAVQATLYIYLPSYADTAIAAYMTDKAIMERFGTKTRRTAYASAPAAGRAGTAIRAVYDDAGDGTLVTAAGFVHAGRWMVKLRVTGPTEQRKDVVAGLDAMLAALQVDDPATLHAAAPARFSACPAADDGDATLTDRAPSARPQAAIAPATAFCVRGKVATGDGDFDLLQQVGVAQALVIVPVDDSGTVVSFAPTGAGYQLAIHAIGQTDLFGVYDKLPSARQIGAIVDGDDPSLAQAGATADYAANGQVTMRTGDAKAR